MSSMFDGGIRVTGNPEIGPDCRAEMGART
jgi:hypothetical protein